MNDSQSHVLVAPKWYEPSSFKLYVCPVGAFTKAKLTEFFTQYADIVDVYMSEPNANGFRWAFVYFTSEESLLQAVSHVEKDNVHNFKLSRAKPKAFTSNGPKYTSNTKTTNGDVSSDGKSFVPNCSSCKKVTFQRCGSCKNPFCSKECALDGWRIHTGPCLQVSELESTSNGSDYSITPSVINFMKDIKQTKKSFTTKDFANACNSSKGMVNTPASIPKQVENAWDEEYVDNSSKLQADRRPCTRNTLTTSFQKRFSISDQDETDKPVARATPKKFQKRDSDTSRQPFKTNNSQKFNSKGPKTDSEDSYNARKKIKNRKPNQKYTTDVDDCEENEPSCGKPYPKPSSAKCTDTFMANGNSFNGPVRNEDNEPKLTKAIPQIRQTDLKLQKDAAAVVVVTSIADPHTFFVANRIRVVQMLHQINDYAYDSPALTKVDLDTRCLASFDNDYYRARVVDIDPIRVEYIDYGNREVCTINDLKVLPESLTKTLPLAAKVKLKSGEVSHYDIEENQEITIFVDQYLAAENIYIVDVL